MGGVKDQDLVSWGLDYDPNKRSLIRDHMLLLKTEGWKNTFLSLIQIYKGELSDKGFSLINVDIKKKMLL